jgi:hypothetical protein
MMTREDLDTVAKLADMLRAKGVRTFKGAGLEMELLPSVEVVSPQENAKALASEADDACLCGCPVYAHEGGLCIHGCAVEKCLPKEKP